MPQSPISLSEQIADAALRRFGESVLVPEDLTGGEELLRMLTHSSHRKWSAQPISQ